MYVIYVPLVNLQWVFHSLSRRTEFALVHKFKRHIHTSNFKSMDTCTVSVFEGHQQCKLQRNSNPPQYRGYSLAGIERLYFDCLVDARLANGSRTTLVIKKF